MTAQAGQPKRVLVAGATGYVGARLVPRLVEAGYAVRAMGRSLQKLQSRPWAQTPGVELVVADVLDAAALRQACRGVDAVCYLVHSMGPGGAHFETADRQAAQNLAQAAHEAGVARILYLGGLGEESPDLSPHLRSRAEVGAILQAGPVPVTVLRAAVILGSGSASFEILRYLADRLPVMLTPRWLSTPVQPIAIRDVLGYLVGCLQEPATQGRTFDIGGPETTTYVQLLKLYAREAGLRRRWIVRVPVLTPRLSTLWIQLVTPAPGYLVRPLAEGLRTPMVCREQSIRTLLPRNLLGCADAIRLAIDIQRRALLESHWSDAGRIPPSAWAMPGDDAWTGGQPRVDSRALTVALPPAQLWVPITRLGGRRGWYFANGLWLTRGAIDALLGGVGSGRGRVRPDTLRVGDVVDFWRVAEVEEGRRVRLVAEMKLPGDAVLELEVQGDGQGSRLVQTAWFRPRGVGGLAYWYLLYPVHAVLFRGLLRGIAREAKRSRAAA